MILLEQCSQYEYETRDDPLDHRCGVPACHGSAIGHRVEGVHSAKKQKQKQSHPSRNGVWSYQETYLKERGLIFDEESRGSVQEQNQRGMTALSLTK